MASRRSRDDARTSSTSIQGGRLTSRILVATLLLSPAVLHSQQRRYVDPRTPGDTTVRPYSAAVLAGNTLYVSGKIGLGADRRVPATPQEEARIVLDDVKSTLHTAGMTMDDLVSVQVFCSDLSHYDAFNSVYRTYFTKEFPARAFIGSGPLLFNARFEIQAIAVKR